MANDVCGEPFAIGTCDRPPHPPSEEHQATMTPPAPMAMILEAAVRAEKRANRWRLVFIVLSLAQALFIIQNIIEGAPQ